MERYFQLVSETEVVDLVEVVSREIDVPRETQLFVQANREPIFANVLSIPAYVVVETTLDGTAGMTVYEDGADKAFVELEYFAPPQTNVSVKTLPIGIEREALLFVQGSGSFLSDTLPPVTPPSGGGSGFYWG